MEKDKRLLAEVRLLLETDPETLTRKWLEPIRGYLVHVAQTYPMFSCYLIGLPMTSNFRGQTEIRVVGDSLLRM